MRHHLLQIVTKLKQGADAAAEEVGYKAADPSRYPQQVCRGLARLLSQGKVDSESAQWLASHGDSVCTVSSATGWNMPTVSPRVVHTLSTRKRGMSRVQYSNYTHNQSRGRRREVLHTEVTGEGDEKSRLVSVNMHRLGESFVEKVSDVRRRATVDGQAAAPGESLEFLAHI